MVNKNETTENEEIQDLEKENKELYARLTNKNKDYFFQLNGQLEELSYDYHKKLVVMNEMLEETLASQDEAVPARKIYGTVTEQADQIVSLDSGGLQDAQKVSPQKYLYLDGALLFGGAFNLANVVSAWRTPEIDLGLIQFLLNFLLGGLVVLALVKYRPEPNQTEGVFKYTLVTIGVMLAWILVMSLVQVLRPSIINPTLSPVFVVGASVLAILAKIYLKKKLDIRGTLF